MFTTFLSAIILSVYPSAIHLAMCVDLFACVKVVIAVIVESGIVIVLSAVGFTTVKVVSCASAVAPSKIIPFAPIFSPEVDCPEANVKAFITGLVKVLFASV